MDIENYQGATEDLSQFAVKNPREIERILSAMIAKKTLVTVQGRKTRQVYLTTLLGLNEQTGKLYFESAKDALADADLRSEAGADLVSHHDGVRVQFVAAQAEHVLYGGLAAYKIALPEVIYRIQRREYFRVPTPQAEPATCAITLPEGEIQAVVLDLSIGGVGLRCPIDAKAPEVGAVLENCRLAIPGLGEYPVRLLVRNRRPSSLKSGAEVWRIGCEFINLSSLLERTLQSYIFKLERQRREQT